MEPQNPYVPVPPQVPGSTPPPEPMPPTQPVVPWQPQPQVPQQPAPMPPQPQPVVPPLESQTPPAVPQGQPAVPVMPQVKEYVPAEKDPYIGLTGSQISAKRRHLPIGVYVIAFLQLVGFGTSFFNTGQTGIIISVAMLFQLMLGIGLLLRMEAARKAMVGFSILLIVLSVVGGVLLFGYQQRIHEATANYNATLQKLGDQSITPGQQKSIDAMRTDISSLQKQAGNAINETYANFGIIGIESLFALIYLTRPSVRESFNARS